MIGEILKYKKKYLRNLKLQSTFILKGEKISTDFYITAESQKIKIIWGFQIIILCNFKLQFPPKYICLLRQIQQVVPCYVTINKTISFDCFQLARCKFCQINLRECAIFEHATSHMGNPWPKGCI